MRDAPQDVLRVDAGLVLQFRHRAVVQRRREEAQIARDEVERRVTRIHGNDAVVVVVEHAIGPARLIAREPLRLLGSDVDFDGGRAEGALVRRDVHAAKGSEERRHDNEGCARRRRIHDDHEDPKTTKYLEYGCHYAARLLEGQRFHSNALRGLGVFVSFEIGAVGSCGSSAYAFAPALLCSIRRPGLLMPVNRSFSPSGHCTTTASTFVASPNPRCNRTSLADK